MQVIPADDPRNPTGADMHFTNQPHEAVDLAAAAGDCVFAAYSERLAIDLLWDAYGGNIDVTLRSRASAFWGVDVVTQGELI